MDHTDATTSPLLSDPTLWLVFSFVAFMVLAFVFGRRSVLSMLDAKIEKIRNDIATAEKLQTEAENLLNQYKDDMKNSSVEADRIIAKAKQQAEDIRAKAEKDLTETMARREEMLANRIQQMELSAMDDIRRYAAELAVSATEEIIAKNLVGDKASSLIDHSITNVGKELN